MPLFILRFVMLNVSKDTFGPPPSIFEIFEIFEMIGGVMPFSLARRSLGGGGSSIHLCNL